MSVQWSEALQACLDQAQAAQRACEFAAKGLSEAEQGLSMAQVRCNEARAGVRAAWVKMRMALGEAYPPGLWEDTYEPQYDRTYESIRNELIKEGLLEPSVAKE